jgi:hypothetical protein
MSVQRYWCNGHQVVEASEYLQLESTAKMLAEALQFMRDRPAWVPTDALERQADKALAAARKQGLL